MVKNDDVVILDHGPASVGPASDVIQGGIDR